MIFRHLAPVRGEEFAGTNEDTKVWSRSRERRMSKPTSSYIGESSFAGKSHQARLRTLETPERSHEPDHAGGRDADPTNNMVAPSAEPHTERCFL